MFFVIVFALQWSKILNVNPMIVLSVQLLDMPIHAFYSLKKLEVVKFLLNWIVSEVTVESVVM